MKVYSQNELKEILRLHELWLEGEDEGVRADLSYSNLEGANLQGANLTDVDLRGVNLFGADLRGADLTDVDLFGANLVGANLFGTDLSGTKLRDCDLRGANLRNADLTNVDLRGANLSYANTLRVTGIKIYSIDNVGSFNGKITYLPSQDKVWAGCWSGTSEEFYKKCEEVQSKHERDLELRIAIYMIKEMKKSYKMEGN